MGTAFLTWWVIFGIGVRIVLPRTPGGRLHHPQRGASWTVSVWLWMMQAVDSWSKETAQESLPHGGEFSEPYGP